MYVIILELMTVFTDSSSYLPFLLLRTHVLTLHEVLSECIYIRT